MEHTCGFFTENYQWLLGFILTAIAVLYIGLLRPLKINRRQKNTTTFETHLKSTYADLFEFEKSGDLSLMLLIANGFNVKEIGKFCQRAVDFKEKGNKFFGCRANKRFYKLYLICKEINNSMEDPIDKLKGAFDPDEYFDIFIERNKNKFEVLKETYKKFVLTFYDNLEEYPVNQNLKNGL